MTIRSILLVLLCCGLGGALNTANAANAANATKAASAAPAYRCTVGDTVTYSDQPCVGGAQKQLDPDPPPSAADRAAAARQARADKAELRRIEAQRARDEKLQVDRGAKAKQAQDKKQSAHELECQKMHAKLDKQRGDLELGVIDKSYNTRLARVEREQARYNARCKPKTTVGLS